MGPRCSCEPPPQRAVTRVLCCVLCSVLGRLALGPGHPSSPPISPTTVFNAIGNVVVCQCGRGGPSQVSAGAGRAWASHRTLCCKSCPCRPLSHHALLCTIPCTAGGARGLRLLQRTGATGIRIFIWPRTRVGTRPEHTPLRPPGDRPQASGWCAWLQPATFKLMMGVLHACLQVRPAPRPVEVYRASLLAESVAAVAAVRGILNAHGGRARVHQAPTKPQP